MSRKTKVLLVAELAPKGSAPRTVIGVVDLTQVEAREISRVIDGRRKEGALRDFYMMPVEAVGRSFKETISLLKRDQVVVKT